MATQTMNGKAFEYACLKTMFDILSIGQDVSIIENEPYEKAKKFFSELQPPVQERMLLAAHAAMKSLLKLEPQLGYPAGNMPLLLSIQADSQGQDGDVRDVLCARRQNGWEIGLSCKHNHAALKHPRLSKTLNFGDKWLGVSCSGEYFMAIKPIFDELVVLKSRGAEFKDIDNKCERFYLPVLNAWVAELRRLDAQKPHVVPGNLVKYLIGRNDFYKVIMNSTQRTTRLEAMNVNGTLNLSSEGVAPLVKVPMIKLPTEFWHIDYKSDREGTIEIGCDNGWTISFRLHNAATKVEPSLKFDITLEGSPALFNQTEGW